MARTNPASTIRIENKTGYASDTRVYCINDDGQEIDIKGVYSVELDTITGHTLISATIKVHVDDIGINTNNNEDVGE